MTTIALYCTSQGHFYIRTLLKRYFNFFCYIKLTLSNTQRFFFEKKKSSQVWAPRILIK